ncbi:MAG: hypothetical protein C7B45_13475 [Sulfobacillus acidophilus]|uniref:Uncharacterized protein n=1 Tax=Sulfobacillus acidophilus TaxID=53633 RepID=A0A2T2WET1_9FIRM|nr:MAG: hypothetical protein C7B45_13475 [Sulfobacillus acidophilus]
MKRLNWLIAVGCASTLLTVASPAFAQGRPHLWGHQDELVSSVTPTTLVIKHAEGLEQQLPMSSVTVQAAMYPATAGILRPGEHVSVLQETGSNPLVIVHPAAYGTLTHQGGQWTIVSRRRGTMFLNGAPSAQLLGLKTVASGQRVMAFGTQTGTTSVDVAALAAKPLITRSTIKTVAATQLTLQSEQYGTLVYSLAHLPPSVRQHLTAMTTGQSVVAGLNPLNHRVLMVWPDRLDRIARTLERGTAGQVIAVSPKDLTLTNHLGTVTIPLNHKTIVRWSGHSQAQLAQVTPGKRVLALRQKDGNLQIMVLS